MTVLLSALGQEMTYNAAHVGTHTQRRGLCIDILPSSRWWR